MRYRAAPGEAGVRDDRLVEMRVFKAVVESGGFTAAAHVLGVSQPFVSQTLRSLERRLGVPLLHRSTRTQRLTDEGRRFLAAARELLDAVEQAESRVGSSEPAGVLRVSAPRAFGVDQVVPVVPAFLAAHPRVEMRLSLSDTLVNLIEDDIDVAVRMGRLADSSLASRKLCDLQRIVVASPGYIAAHGEPATPAELERHNCLMWQGALDHLNRWPFLVDGERVEVAVRGNFRSGDGTTLFQLCTAGAGVMRLAEHLALPAIRGGRLVALLAPWLARDDTAIHAVFLAQHQPVPRVRAFVDHLVEVFRQPPWAAATAGGDATHGV